ncbi:MAG: glycosyltransferase family 4 protein [Candidatus Paceibacterota bacterium]
MKKVLIFSLSYFPHVGGAEIALKEITERLRDIEFHIVTLRMGRELHEERVGNVMVHRVDGGASYFAKILFIPRAAALAARLHAQKQFDGLWAMMSYMVLPVALLRMRGVCVPYVLTLQDGDPFRHVFMRPHIFLFLPLLRYGFHHASAVTVLSTYLAAWARRMGYQGEPVVIPNGADVRAFAGAMPLDIGKKEGEFWLVTSSRLVHKNAVDVVVRSLVLLPEYVHFLVLGAGPEESRLKALARELELDSRVRFKGYVSHAELPGYLHACDAFVRPSRSEGFGSSFVEAMAAGLPVVATQEGGIVDFLFDTKRNPGAPATGFAVDPDVPEQIADAVKEIMTNPKKVQQVRENAFALVREKYDWGTVAEQTRALFATIGI